jgi:MFS family permease
LSRGLGISGLTRGLLFHGNIRVIALTSLVTGLYVSMLNAILQPFVVHGLAVGVFWLGVLQAVGSRPGGLASSLVQPFAGYLADTIGRKKLIVAGSFVAICSMVSFLDAALSHNLIALALGYVLFGLSLMSSPASQAMVAESVAMDPVKLGSAFSLVFFFTQIPGAFASYLGGPIADSLGYYVIFIAAVFLESANLITLLKFVKETGKDHNLPYHGTANHFSLRDTIRLPPGFLRIFTPFAMDAFSYGLSGSIIYGMWVSTFHFSGTDISLVVGTLSISILAFQYPALRFFRRVGIRKTLAFSEFLYVVILLGWLFTSSLSVYVFLAALFGLSVALWVPALYSLVMSSAPAEQRGSISGKLAAFRGLIGVPGPIIGGYLFSLYGYYLPITLGLIGEALTTVALWKLIPRAGERKAATVESASNGAASNPQ